MKPAGPPERLRDGRGDATMERAAAVVRSASAAPAALSAHAQARIVSALRGATAPRSSGALRLAVQAAVLCAVAATGFGAAAGLSWYRKIHEPAPPPPPPPAVEAPRPVERKAPPPPRPAPRRRVARAPAPEPEPVATPPEIVEPKLAIDPQDPRYSIALPPDLQQAGAVFPALFEVCVAADGSVTSAKVRRSPSPRLDPDLLKMVNTWRFSPARRDGIAVPACTPVDYEMRISPPGK
jgi:TonB family protein